MFEFDLKIKIFQMNYVVYYFTCILHMRVRVWALWAFRLPYNAENSTHVGA